MRLEKSTHLLVLVVLLLAGLSTPALAQPPAVRDQLPQQQVACALLDDLEARGLMSAMFETKLMILCDRQDELGSTVPAGDALQTPAGVSQVTDVLVNNPAGDIGMSTTQSETSIAVNADTGTICSAYHDSQHWAQGSIGFSGFSRSTDGGTTFSDRGAFPPGGGGNSFGDPSMAWRRVDGRFYYATLHSSGLGLWRSTDDCDTFAFHSMIHTGAGDDYPKLIVDNTPTSPYYGRMYVAWTDFAAGARIHVTYSDNATTWSTPVAVSAAGVDVQGAWPAVAPSGAAYVAWVRWNPYPNGPIDIELVRSTDGGASFGPRNNPMTGQVNPRDATASTDCGRPALNANTGDGIRLLPSPQIVAGRDGCLHVVYSYDPDGYNTGDVINVYYRRSCDGGFSWGPEIQVNDDGTLADQWFPTISVGESNTLVATWYDRRNDPGNNYLFDYYKAISYDGGSTWGPNIRVSDVSSAVPQLNPNFDPIIASCYHGDYDQQVQLGPFAYIPWSDDRNIQNGHPDPDIWFEREPILTPPLFDPSPLHVTLPWDSAFNTLAVLTNTMPGFYSFNLFEIPGGFAPATQPPSILAESHVGPDHSRSAEQDAGATVLAGAPTGARGASSIEAYSWFVVAPNPLAVSRPAGAVDADGYFYVVGGESVGGTWLGQIQRYDPTENTWDDTLATMPAAVSNLCAAVIGDDLYVPGGYDGSAGISDLQVYHIASDTWETIASDPLPTGRSGPACASYEGKVYVFGGSDTNSTWVYDPLAPAGTRWSTLSSAPFIGSYGTAVVVNDLIFYGGVYDAGDSANVAAYDPSTDTWTSYPNLNVARAGAGMWTVGNLLLVGGGGWSSYLTSIEQYDTTEGPGGSWIPFPANLVQGRRTFAHSTDSGRGRLFVGAGWAGAFLAEAERFDLTADVPWLGETPNVGVLPAFASTPITLRFSATLASGVNQPGDYSAHLLVAGNPSRTVPVTMTVLPPPDMGKVEGTVSDLCHGSPVEARVAILGGDPITETLSDPSGYYAAWLYPGTYDFVFSATGYLPRSATADVVAEVTHTLDVALRPTQACIAVDPPVFEVWVFTGTAVYTHPAGLDVINRGTDALDFEIFEQPGGYLPPPPISPVAPPPAAATAVPAPLPALASSLSTALTSHGGAPAGYAVIEAATPLAWSFGAPLPGGIVRYAHAQCPGDTNAFYVIAGVDGTFTPTPNAWRYDAAGDTWIPLTPIPSAVEGPSAVCYEGKIYVAGGGATTQFYIYDIATDAWSPGATLPRNVWGAAMGAWNGQVFLVGGDNDFIFGGTSDQVDIYDIASDTWSGTGASMPAAAVTAGWFQQGPYLYVVGGWGLDDTVPISNVNVTQRYDLQNDVWDTGPEFTIAKADFALAATGQYLYAIGGDANGNAAFDPSNSVWRYNWTCWPGGDWVNLFDPLPTALSANNAGFATGAVSGGKVWSVGGLAGSFIVSDTLYRSSEPPWLPPMDVPWIWEEPISATVPAGTTGNVKLMFSAAVTDAMPLGTYSATLVLYSNDCVAGPQYVRVIMHVTDQATIYLPLVFRQY